MKYPKEYLEEIKTRLKVSTVVSKYVSLKIFGGFLMYAKRGPVGYFGKNIFCDIIESFLFVKWKTNDECSYFNIIIVSICIAYNELIYFHLNYKCVNEVICGIYWHLIYFLKSLTIRGIFTSLISVCYLKCLYWISRP